MEHPVKPNRRAILLGAGAACASPALLRAAAADYPQRTVRIVVPFAPGGPSDITARAMSVKLTEVLGQTFVIENRAGAGSNLGTAAAARSPADGYTLLVTSSALVVNPSLYKNVPYDVFKDFAPIAELDTSPNVFVATHASGITSIADMLARAKADPNALSYASAGVGTTPHLAVELLKILSGANLTHIPYQGSGPGVQAILAGTVPLMCGSLPGSHPHIKAGALRALAVTGTTRWHDMPDVPTMIELGYQDFVIDTFHCMAAPAQTPRDIVEKLAKTCVDILNVPAFRHQLRTMGFEPIANGPEGLAKRIATDVERYRVIIEKAGIARV